MRPAVWWACVVLAAGAAIFFLLGGSPGGARALSAQNPPTNRARFELGGNVARGRQVYEERCVLCHGGAGDGRGEMGGVMKPPPADLTNAAKMGKRSDFDLYRTVADGGPAVGLSPAMMGFKGLMSDSDVRSVAAFVRTLAKKSAVPRR
jgi:mono/diheme cytochrome c family protein